MVEDRIGTSLDLLSDMISHGGGDIIAAVVETSVMELMLRALANNSPDNSTMLQSCYALLGDVARNGYAECILPRRGEGQPLKVGFGLATRVCSRWRRRKVHLDAVRCRRVGRDLLPTHDGQVAADARAEQLRLGPWQDDAGRWCAARCTRVARGGACLLRETACRMVQTADRGRSWMSNTGFDASISYSSVRSHKLTPGYVPSLTGPTS